MAERRMMSKKITDTDAFLDMPLTTQALYFHFLQNADDDGFVGSPNSIMRKVGASKNDYDLLIVKRFIIVFDTGICVIKHWRIHNYIQKDRYTPTTFLKEKAQLETEANGAYTDKKVECIQPVSNSYPQYSVGEDSIGKDSIGGVGESVLTTEEYNELVSRLGASDTDYYIQRVLAFKKKKPDAIFDMKSTILKWVREDKTSGKARTENGAGAVEKTYTAEALNSMFDNLSTDEL